MPDRIELRNEELRTQPLYAGRVVSGGFSCLTVGACEILHKRIFVRVG